MIQQKDRAILNSIFLPKHLFASEEVRIVLSESDQIDQAASVVISFVDPILMKGFDTRSFNYINNPDGTIRWIFPIDARSPQFLEFYNTTSPRAKAFALACKLAFKLKLQRFISAGKFHVMTKGATRIEQALSATKHDTYSIFTGTDGVNRSFLVAVGSGGKTTHFLKGMIDPADSEAIYHEQDQLENAGKLNLNNVVTPDSSIVKGDLLMESIRPKNSAQSGHLNEVHHRFLCDLGNQTGSTISISECDFAKKISTGLDRIVPDQRISEELYNLIEVHRPLLRSNAHIPVSQAHGDFTPWNMFLNGKELNVIDWELGMDKAPMLFDLFHFIFQSERFIYHGDTNGISNRIQKAINHPLMDELINKYGVDPHTHLRLYLLYVLAYYLPEYQRNETLTADQVAQMNVWTEQLAQLIPTMKEVSHRKVFLQAFSGELALTEHAMLKFKPEKLTDLPESSDLDILLNRVHVDDLVEFVAGSSLVNKYRVQKKSYMTVIRIFFKDGSFLSLDLIYRFKRKWTEYIDAKSILNEACPDRYGIRRAKAKHELQYSLLFYTLNGAPIPQDYYQYFMNRCEGQTKILRDHLNWAHGLNFKTLKEAFKYSQELHAKLVGSVANYPENKGLKGMMNKVLYYFDTARDMLRSEGMIITFSGVDGAGKSTIIEDIRSNLSRKYRKQVVVLRHRPAVLPILSAYKHGTEKANKISSVRMPRTGTNKSQLGSLARFAYYLVDYIVGQVVVHLKHTIRGHIVLYDRYYFDFIHDAKRTNIVLPPWFMKMFYPLIYKPRLNFFLYAPSEVILARKQELDKTAIEELTQRYGSHFDSLSMKYNNDVYRKIKNTDRERTVETILQDYQAVA